jgi:hypothetical protein
MSKISILKDIYLENRFIYNKLEAILFEEMRRIDFLWEIVKYTASLLRIFNAYEFCCFNFLPKNMNCFPFQRSSKFHKLPFNLRKNLNLPNNLFYLY